jgi:small-conductance mechanosensitive channel
MLWTQITGQHAWLAYAVEISGLVLAAWVLRAVIIRYFGRWAKRTRTNVDDHLVDLLSAALGPLLVLAVLAVSLNSLPVPDRLLSAANRISKAAAIFLALYYGAKFIQLFIDGWLESNAARQSLREPARFFTRVVFAGMAAMIVLDNLGVSLTAVWTTLGVGSVAIALALQDTLSNFFAGVYLRLDRPARIGDYIKLESGEEGFVEEPGWRSTRIRTLPNNIVVIPNAKLASAIVTNYSLPEPQMSLLVSVSVSYQADPQRVEQILVEEASSAAGKLEGLLADPAPFVRFIPGFGDSSLDFTLICRVSSFVDQYLVQHELRKRIFARFQREGISIPFPQRDVHLHVAQGVAFKATGV